MDETSEGFPHIIWVILGLYIGFQIIKEKIKWAFIKGRPSIGLEIEWPANYSGTVSYGDEVIAKFPMQANSPHILRQRQNKYKETLVLDLDDPALLNADSLELTVEYQQTSESDRMRDVEIEALLLFVENNGKFISRELSEYEFNLNPSGSQDIIFSGIQNKLKPYKSKIDALSASPTSNSKQSSVERL